MGIFNAHSINRKCIIAGAAATARAKGRSNEGREAERGREKGRQPVTERNTLNPMERHAETSPTHRQPHRESHRQSWIGQRRKRKENTEREK